MFCTLLRLDKKAVNTIRQKALAAPRWLELRVRRPSTAHRDTVASNVSYAAATAAVLGGLLGLVSARDVLAAVLAAAFGVYLRGTRDTGGATEPPAAQPLATTDQVTRQPRDRDERRRHHSPAPCQPAGGFPCRRRTR